MKTLRILIAMLVIGSMTLANAQQQGRDTRAEVALQAAVALETVDGNLPAAIAAYKKVVADFPSSRAVAAEALARLGQCYEKQGTAQKEEARKAYQQIVSSYADQKDAASRAAERLAALGNAQAAPRMLLRVEESARRSIIGVSADGRFAYLHGGLARRGSGADLIARDLSSGAERVLPGVPVTNGEVSARRISPDGRQIVHAFSTPPQAKCTISVSGANGGPPRTVATLAWRACHGLNWSDDGQRLLVWGETATEDVFDYALLSLSDGKTLWRFGKDAAGAESSFMPISPDGRFVAIRESSDADTISLFDSQTGAVSRRSGAPLTSAPIWAADGRAILFVAGRPGERSLWRVAVSSSGELGRMDQVKADVGPLQLLRAMRDGSLFYTSAAQSAPPDWHMATLDPRTGTGDSIAALAGVHRICGTAWSPDGSSVLFGARLLKEYGGEVVPCTLLVIRSLGDGHERVLSPGFTEIRRPSWSRDGKSVAVFGRKDGVAGAYIIDVQSGESRLVVRAPDYQTLGEDILTADWSHDGKGVFLGRIENSGVTRRFRLVYRDLQSGEETERYSKSLPGRVFFTSTSVSRNGDVCLLANVFTEGVEQRAAIVVPVGGRAARTILSVPITSRFSWVSWAADGRSILVDSPAPTAAEPRLRRLMQHPLDGGPALDLRIARPAMGNHYPSPDGKHVLFGTFPGAGPGAELWTMSGAGASVGKDQK